jgi:glycosyltransferase involved in cell wall biosynthesis
VSHARQRVLYFTHNGLTEPLGRRQVLPYLVGLAARGWRFTVVSFEKPETATPAALETVERVTRAAGIRWTRLHYRRRPPIVATALNVLEGILQGSRHRGKIDLLHARSAVPALVARSVAWLLRTPWIFDVRGLLAEEYVDAGHWPRGGLRYRVTSAIERALLRSADGVVVLTHRVARELGTLGVVSDRPRAVIPCCADIDVFRPSEEVRRGVRGEMGWGDEPVLVYSGSLGSWYRLEEMLDFHEAARAEMPTLRFLLLTPQATLAEEAAWRRVLSSQIVVRSVDPDAVPRYLAACDVGICFLGEHASKVASSPTKYGEYLAAGLPVVTNGWIGDAQRFKAEPTWLLVDAFETEGYRQAARRISDLLGNPATTRRAARALAERELATAVAMERYEALYREVLSGEG